MTVHPQGLQRARQALAAARRPVVFTGAGMSADSGIATFRDALTGLWSNFDPQALATRAGFEADPPLVWGWYTWRRQQLRQARPNAGHLAVARWARRQPGLVVVTQNVDDLHERAVAEVAVGAATSTDAAADAAADRFVGGPAQRAGAAAPASAAVLHLHGQLLSAHCLHCGTPHPLPDDEPPLPRDGCAVPPPRCGACGGPVRPGVVWFGEPLPADAWHAARRAVKTCDALLVVGTSGVVYPAAGLITLAAEAGTPVWVVDPQPIAGLDSHAATHLAGRAAELLPSLLDPA